MCLFGDWDWHGALQAFDAAVEINPSYEFARRGRAHTLAYSGRLEDARRDIDHALDVETRWGPIRDEPRIQELRRKSGLRDSASGTSI